MSENLSYEQAIAFLPHWEWVRVLVRRHEDYPVEHNWPHAVVLEALQKAAREPSFIEIAEPGAQRRGFGLRIDFSGERFDVVYVETRTRTDGE